MRLYRNQVTMYVAQVAMTLAVTLGFTLSLRAYSESVSNTSAKSTVSTLAGQTTNEGSKKGTATNPSAKKSVAEQATKVQTPFVQSSSGQSPPSQSPPSQSPAGKKDATEGPDLKAAKDANKTTAARDKLFSFIAPPWISVNELNNGGVKAPASSASGTLSGSQDAQNAASQRSNASGTRYQGGFGYDRSARGDSKSRPPGTIDPGKNGSGGRGKSSPQSVPPTIPDQSIIPDLFWPLCLFLDPTIGQGKGNQIVKGVVDLAAKCGVLVKTTAVTLRAGYPDDPGFINDAARTGCNAPEGYDVPSASTTSLVSYGGTATAMCGSPAAGCAEGGSGGGLSKAQLAKMKATGHGGIVAKGNVAASIEVPACHSGGCVSHEALGHSQMGQPNGSSHGMGIGAPGGGGGGGGWTGAGCGDMRKNAFPNVYGFSYNPQEKLYYVREEDPEFQYSFFERPPLFPTRRGPGLEPPIMPKLIVGKNIQGPGPSSKSKIFDDEIKLSVRPEIPGIQKEHKKKAGVMVVGIGVANDETIEGGDYSTNRPARRVGNQPQTGATINEVPGNPGSVGGASRIVYDRSQRRKTAESPNNGSSNTGSKSQGSAAGGTRSSGSDTYVASVGGGRNTSSQATGIFASVGGGAGSGTYGTDASAMDNELSAGTTGNNKKKKAKKGGVRNSSIATSKGKKATKTSVLGNDFFKKRKAVGGQANSAGSGRRTSGRSVAGELYQSRGE